MTELQFVNWALLALLSAGGWFMKRTLDNTERQILALELSVQQVKDNYLHKNDFKEFKSELRGMFEEIRQDIKELKKHP